MYNVEDIIEIAENITEDTPTDELIDALIASFKLLTGIELSPPKNMEKETVAKWTQDAMTMVQTILTSQSNPNIENLIKAFNEN